MNLKKIYYRWKARRQLISKSHFDVAVDEVIKDYITDCITQRNQEHRRKELVEMQNKLNEDELFLKWIKARKIIK